MSKHEIGTAPGANAAGPDDDWTRGFDAKTRANIDRVRREGVSTGSAFWGQFLPQTTRSGR